MRHIVALPDYSQSGSISAWTEQGIRPLKQALSEAGVELDALPPSFVIGIPEPVLKDNNENGFVLSQVIRLENSIVMSTSCKAGLDKSGRHVFLTELTFGNDVEESIRELNINYKTIDLDTEKEISLLINKMRKKSFNDLMNILMILSKSSRYKHVSSVKMVGMRYQPDWPKKKLINWLPSGGKYYIVSIVLLVMGIMICAYLAKGR